MCCECAVVANDIVINVYNDIFSVSLFFIFHQSSVVTAVELCGMSFVISFRLVCVECRTISQSFTFEMWICFVPCENYIKYIDFDHCKLYNFCTVEPLHLHSISHSANWMSVRQPVTKTIYVLIFECNSILNRSQSLFLLLSLWQMIIINKIQYIIRNVLVNKCICFTTVKLVFSKMNRTFTNWYASRHVCLWFEIEIPFEERKFDRNL